MELRQIRDAFAAGFAWAVGHSMAMDEDKWVTLKPHGRSVKGTKVRIDEKTNKIEAGAGGNLNGKKLSDLGDKKVPQKEEKTPERRAADEPIGEESLKKSVINIIRNELSGGKYGSLVRKAAKMAFGSVTCNLPGSDDSKILVNRNFLDECCKYIRKHSDEKFVKSVLYGIAYLPQILKSGKRHQWRDGGERHPGSEFCTITKKYKMPDGEIFEVAIDVERNTGKENSEVHLVNSSYNEPYYSKKKRNLKPIASDADTASCKVTGIRVRFLK